MLITFGTRLASLRKEKDLSQAELGKLLGVSASTIGMYEKDKRQPNFEMEEKIADFFNVDLLYLRGIQDSKTLNERIENAKREAVAQLDAEEEELNEYLNALKNNPGMRVLFSKTKNAKKEDIEKVIKMLDIMRGDDDDGGYY